MHMDPGAPLSDWNHWMALEAYLQVQSRNGGRRGPKTPQPCTILVEPQDPYSSYITPRPVTGALLPLDTGGGCMVVSLCGSGCTRLKWVTCFPLLSPTSDLCRNK